MSTTTTRAKIIIPPPELRAERQRVEDERSRLASASGVQYQADTDLLVLDMRSGITITLPRRLVDELADAPQATLKKELALHVGGDALSVPSLDVDIAVAGLLRDLLGFNIQRKGGQARSDAKAAASRANGAKGGRPHKTHAA
jgi:hypothetical protein